MNDVSKTFECLYKSAEHAIQFDTTKGNGRYTFFIVNRIEYSSVSAVKDHTENDSGLLLKSLKGERYKQFETDPRMVKLIGKLMPAARF